VASGRISALKIINSALFGTVKVILAPFSDFWKARVVADGLPSSCFQDVSLIVLPLHICSG
jgi:hypothetical protein